ncbi:helix-turn-helix transcriptional regulator [Bdellovibrionota bacterium FG-2]
MRPEIDKSSKKLNTLPTRLVMNLKAQLKQHLEHRGMSAAELARKSGVSRQVISLWLTGVVPKNIGHLKKVADALGTTIDNLMFGNEQRNNERKVTDLDALLGDSWISGVFEVRLRRIRKLGNGENEK